MSIAGIVTRKQDKYRPLIAALRNAGWSVALLTHVNTGRARATVSIRNEIVPKELGIVNVVD
jgi:hypothetical protein